MPRRRDRPARAVPSATAVAPAAPPGGEFELIRRIRAFVARHAADPGLLVGIGDDAAVFDPSILARRAGRGRAPAARGRGALVLTTDTMVEGVHFRSSWLRPRELGVRALRAAVSDVAAMGARPRLVLLGLEVPAGGGGIGEAAVLAAVRALVSEAHRCGATLAGGNVTAAPALSLAVTVIGQAAARPLLRGAAQAGDLVFVTGSLGGAAAGCRLLAAADRRRPRREVPARRTTAWRRPPLRVELAATLAERGLVHAMIDVSDGLLQDLGHVAAESGATVQVDPAAVPVHAAARHWQEESGEDALALALTGGEDYELAFTAPARSRRRIEAVAAGQRVPLRVIGAVHRGVAAVHRGAAVVLDPQGCPLPLATGGHDHLRGRAPRRTRKR